MKLRCRLGWHDWENWEHVKTQQIFENDTDTRPAYSKVIYAKKCNDCQITKINTIKV